jgi:hypothetical protein
MLWLGNQELLAKQNALQLCTEEGKNVGHIL